MFFLEISNHTCKIQVKVDIGESHVQEMGGSKSGGTLVNYRSESNFERHLFFNVFWVDMEMDL